MVSDTSLPTAWTRSRTPRQMACCHCGSASMYASIRGSAAYLRFALELVFTAIHLLDRGALGRQAVAAMLIDEKSDQNKAGPTATSIGRDVRCRTHREGRKRGSASNGTRRSWERSLARAVVISWSGRPGRRSVWKPRETAPARFAPGHSDPGAQASQP